MSMKLKIFFKTGGMVELEPPEGFDFAACCTAVRAAGFFNNGALYIDHGAINAMLYATEEQVNVVPMDKQKVVLQ